LESFNGISFTGEVGGYGARVGSHYDNQAWGPFIVQGVLLLVGPLFFAATIYMMLGRTIRLAGGEEVSIIKPKWCTWIFVGADVSTLIIQGLGKLPHPFPEDRRSLIDDLQAHLSWAQ
jgi:hypothetical protein